MSSHFVYLLQVSKKKKSLKSDFIHFSMVYYMYPRGRGRQSPGDNILMSTKRPYHIFTHLLQLKKKSL